VNSPPPKLEVILTNFFAEPTVLLVSITSRAIGSMFFKYMLKIYITILGSRSIVRQSYVFISGNLY